MASEAATVAKAALQLATMRGPEVERIRVAAPEPPKVTEARAVSVESREVADDRQKAGAAAERVEAEKRSVEELKARDLAKKQPEEARKSKEEEERQRREAKEAEAREKKAAELEAKEQARRQAEEAREQAKRQVEEARKAKEEEERQRKEAKEAEARQKKIAEQEAREQAKKQAEEAHRAKEADARKPKAKEPVLAEAAEAPQGPQGELPEQYAPPEIFEGNVELTVSCPGGAAQVSRFQELLTRFEDIRIASSGGGTEQAQVMTVSLQKPVPLILILNHMALVDEARKEGGKVIVALRKPPPA